MKNKKRKKSERSKCCGAKVKVIGKTTLHYQCLKCKKPCDVYFVQRKFWKINPSTKIIPNKKRRKSIKLTPKELREIHRNEDF